MSLLELYNGILSTSLILNVAANYRDVPMSLVLTKRSTLNLPLAAKVHSNPLQLTIFNTATCLSTGCSFTIVLQTIDNQTYYNGQSTAGSIIRNCMKGDSSTLINLCENGYAVQTSCNGVSTYDITTQCPYRLTQPGCGRLSTDASTTVNDICQMISYSGPITYCNCTISTSRYNTPGILSLHIGTIVVSSIVVPQQTPSNIPTSLPTSISVDTSSNGSHLSTSNTIIVGVMFSFITLCCCLSLLFYCIRNKKKKNGPIFRKWSLNPGTTSSKLSDNSEYYEEYPAVPIIDDMEDQSTEPADNEEKDDTHSLSPFKLSTPSSPTRSVTDDINCPLMSSPWSSPTRSVTLADIYISPMAEVQTNTAKEAMTSSKGEGAITSSKREGAMTSSKGEGAMTSAKIEGAMTSSKRKEPMRYHGREDENSGIKSFKESQSPPPRYFNEYEILDPPPFFDTHETKEDKLSGDAENSSSSPNEEPLIDLSTLSGLRGSMNLFSKSYPIAVDGIILDFNNYDSIYKGNSSTVMDSNFDLSILSGLRGSFGPHIKHNMMKSHGSNGEDEDTEEKKGEEEEGEGEIEEYTIGDGNKLINYDSRNDSQLDRPISLAGIYLRALNPFGEHWSGTATTSIISHIDKEEDEGQLVPDGERSRPISLAGLYLHALNPLGNEWYGGPASRVTDTIPPPILAVKVHDDWLDNIGTHLSYSGNEVIMDGMIDNPMVAGVIGNIRDVTFIEIITTAATTATAATATTAATTTTRAIAATTVIAATTATATVTAVVTAAVTTTARATTAAISTAASANPFTITYQAPVENSVSNIPESSIKLGAPLIERKRETPLVIAMKNLPKCHSNDDIDLSIFNGLAGCKAQRVKWRDLEIKKTVKHEDANIDLNIDLEDFNINLDLDLDLDTNVDNN